MRALAVLVLAVLLAAAAPVSAEDAAALRRELEQMRADVERLHGEYRRALQRLTDRLQRLEAAASAAASGAPGPGTPGGAAPDAGLPGAGAPATGDRPSLADYIQPRAPFAAAERAGRGQLLFDIGVVADAVASLVQHNVERARAGSFAGRENRFFPREIELNLYGQIDPYARGTVRLEAGEEFEDGERVTEVGLAEAHLTLLTLPFGTQLKLGQMRARFGLLNEHHREGLPQTDQPAVLTRFLGEEGLVERGVELGWVAPLPFYLEALVGLFDGDNDTAFGRGSLQAPLATGRLRAFFELGETGALQLGASAASGQTPARRRQTLAGYDVKYKLTPEGWRHPLLTLGTEGIHSLREVEVTGDPDGDGIDESDVRTRHRFGWYAWAELQPWKRWAGGLRYDSTQLLEAPGREWAVEPYLAFMPSDFLRFRLGWKHTERDRREPFTADGSTARIADELLFQATFFLGAHQPHPF